MPQGQPRDPFLDALDAVQGSPAGVPAMNFAIVNGQRVPVDDAPDPFLAALDDVQQVPPTDDRSMFSRAYDAVFTAPAAVTEWATRRANEIDDPATRDSDAFSYTRGPRAFAAGAVQGIGTLLTPGDVVLTALGARPVREALRGVRGASDAMLVLNRAAALATGLRGGERALDAESGSDVAAGVAQAAFGSAGLVPGAKPPPAPARPVRGALPPGARFVGAPDGRVAPTGTDIPMQAAPDGSYVRSVPAEYARREPRGLLGPGARFVGGERGAAAPVERAGELDPMATRPAPSADVSSVRSQPAAVVEREIDPTRQPAAQAVRVKQFSGDPAAVDAPLVSDEDRGVLAWMLRDLQGLPSQRGRLVRREGDVAGSVYARGGPGSPVGDDIRAIAGNRPDNASIQRAIDDLLAGKPVSNRLHVAVLDAVQGYREGRGSYRGPALPMDAPGSGGDVDDFAAFEAAFDDVAAQPGGREPGEEGFAATELLIHGGSAIAGAAAGAAIGETPEAKVKNAVLGLVGGAVAPSVLRRGRGPVQPSVAQPRPVSPAGHSASGASGTRAFARQLQAEGIAPESPEWAARFAARGTTEQGARVPRTGRRGDPLDAPLEGFEPFLAKFSNPLVRDGVARVIRDNGGYATQRRGEVNSRAIGRFADDVRVNLDRSLPKGSALTGEAITAYARALQQTTRKVEDLAARVNSGQATDADVLALQAARAEQDVIAKSLIGARTEAGRALAAFNFWGSVLESGNINLIRDAATKLREDAATIAAGLAQLPADPLTRYRWLQAQSKVPPWSRLRTYYLANLLSGPKTHERNILGNLFNLTADVVTMPIAAGIDAARSAATGAPRTVRLSELPAAVSGSIVGIEKGLRDALFALRHGIHPAALTKSVGLAEARGKLDLPAPELPGGGLNPLNWPFRALHAPDALFRAISRESELSAILFNVAKNEGHSGSALLDRVAELRAGMTPEAIAIRQQADDASLRRVFLEKPGELTEGVVRLSELSRVGFFVAPFIRISSAIARQGAQFSPFGFFMKAARQDGRAGTQAQARAVAGTVAAGYLFWLAETGRLSGDGPRDPAKRAALMESGWRPNSIRMGDRWVSYQPMQPISVPAAVVANAVEGWRERQGKPGEVPGLIAQTLARTANSFLEQSFLSGLFDVVEAMKDPEANAERAASRVAFGLVPGSSAIRSLQQARDPVVRKPEGMTELIKAQVPGLSESVPARTDRFGETVTREGGPARRTLDPFNVSTVKHDPIAEELDRLGVKLTLPSDKLTLPQGLTLSREDAAGLRQAKGRAVRRELEKLLASPGYQRASDGRRIAWVERVIDRARATESRVARQRAKHGARTRSVASGKFTGALRGAMSRAEIESLIPQLSELAGRQLTYDEVKAEVIQRGRRVVE